MKRYLLLIGFATVFHCMAPNLSLAADLKMTCMEMLKGIPSEPVTYTFYEKTGELRSSNYTEGPLSTFQEAVLGHTTGDLGGSTSYVSHKWIKESETLTRTVKHVPDPGSKEKPWAFVQIYDFKRQMVLDGNNKNDSCNHRLYRE